MAMSRKTRTRTATARPYSSRNTRSISEIGAAVSMEGPNLDRERRRPGKLGAPFERGIEIGRFDDAEPTDVFFAFGERAIRDEKLALPDPHDRGRVRRVESTREHPRAGGLH